MNVILDINPFKIRLMNASSRATFNYSCTSKGPKESNGSQVVMFKVSLNSNERGGGRVKARNEVKDWIKKKEATLACIRCLGIFDGRG